jgi:hypothetical protein
VRTVRAEVSDRMLIAGRRQLIGSCRLQDTAGAIPPSQVTDVIQCAQHAWRRGLCQSPGLRRYCQLPDTVTADTVNSRADPA